jgi:hypothetical protein
VADRRIIDLQEINALDAATFVATDSEGHGTRKYDLGALVNALTGAYPIWDSTNNRYTNESIAAMLDARRDGLSYGVSIPKGSATTCTKIASNAGIANPTPGVIGTAAIDPYVGRGPFRYYEVNGYVDSDGTPHVTAIMGDGRFKRDGSNGDVWIMTPVLWWREITTGEDAVERYISDTRLTGMSAQPHAYLPNGTLRPYMLYAKYAGCKGTDGYMHSYSGFAPWTREISHDSCIQKCRNASTGYSGKSVADDWYVKIMFQMKYASKHSQGVFAGCTSYNLNYAVTVAESGVTRVIIAKANANNLLVGSSVSLGSSDHSNSVFGHGRIASITSYDTNNSAVNIDTTSTFTTTTSLKLSTEPWRAGSCDMVEGDGSPTSNTSGKEPFVLQGIECMVGCLEVLGDVIVTNNGSTGWVPYVCHDSRNESTSITSNYTSTGRAMPTDTTDSHKYPLYTQVSEGLDFGSTTGGSQSTGLCDSHYTNKMATTGTREWLSVGYLWDGGNAGLWCVGANVGLTGTGWVIGGRLSATGRAA